MRPHDVLGLARLSGAILRYLRAHPQVADTVAGIAELFGKNPPTFRREKLQSSALALTPS